MLLHALKRLDDDQLQIGGDACEDLSPLGHLGELPNPPSCRAPAGPEHTQPDPCELVDRVHRQRCVEKDLGSVWNAFAALSASIMIVLIAMLVGIDDIAALMALIGVNAAMIGFGWLQERYESPGGGLGPFWLGCLAGVVPWAAIGAYQYLIGERSYITLSLVAKSLLAWQIFASTLASSAAH